MTWDDDILLGFPEPKYRIKEIIEDIYDGISVVWCFPYNVKTDAYVNNVFAMIAKDYALHIDSKDLEEDLSPWDFFPEVYDWCQGQERGLHINTILGPEFPDMLLIKGIDRVCDKNKDEWARFIQGVSQKAKNEQRDSSKSSKSLLIPCSNIDFISRLSFDVFLRDHWFWGWYGCNELRLIIRTLYRKEFPSYPEMLWGESVFAELAGTDYELFNWLCENVPVNSSLESVFECLVYYSRQKSLTINNNFQEVISLTGINKDRKPGSEGMLRPPEKLKHAWNEGIVAWNPDDGAHIVSTYLAIANEYSKLGHRVWRGQSRLLLPILDALRQQVCQYMRNRFSSWLTFCHRVHSESAYNQNNETDYKLVLEFGDIERFLTENGDNSTKHRQLKTNIVSLRKVRNTLAHYETIEWERFCRTIMIVDQIVSLIAY